MPMKETALKLFDACESGKAVEAEYVYIMRFEGDKVSHMTKVWNDGFSFRQLGWE